jgi:hypothetical protein
MAAEVAAELAEAEPAAEWDELALTFMVGS